jgi:hypothetical protein
MKLRGSWDAIRSFAYVALGPYGPVERISKSRVVVAVLRMGGVPGDALMMVAMGQVG